MRRSVWSTAILLLTARLAAQTPPENAAVADLDLGGEALAAPQAFGAVQQALHIGAAAFQTTGTDSAYDYGFFTSGYLHQLHLTLPGFWEAPFSLPPGARITQMCLYARKDGPNPKIELFLQAVRLAPAGQPVGVTTIDQVDFTYEGGYGVVCKTLSPTYTYHDTGDVDGSGDVEHVVHRLLLFMKADFGNGAALGGVRLFWRRQVSPDPSASSFDDVPAGHPFHRWIEALRDSGITGGCSASPPQFCPDSPVTRGQMAVFLSVALGLHWPY